MSATSENLSAHSDQPVRTSPFVWSRIASLVSLLPLGVWTINHLWDNLAAFSGAEAWQTAVTHYPSPIAHALTLTIVFVPLLIHTVWGVQRALNFKPTDLKYSPWGNLKYALQRISGLGVLAFLGAHIFLAFIRPRFLEGHAEPFADIAREMRFHGPTLIVYLLGTLGVAYHLANGISSFAWQWGLISGKKSLARFDVLSIILLIIFVAMSWGAIYALYTAGGELGPAPTH